MFIFSDWKLNKHAQRWMKEILAMRNIFATLTFFQLSSLTKTCKLKRTHNFNESTWRWKDLCSALADTQKQCRCKKKKKEKKTIPCLPPSSPSPPSPYLHPNCNERNIHNSVHVKIKEFMLYTVDTLKHCLSTSSSQNKLSCFTSPCLPPASLSLPNPDLHPNWNKRDKQHWDYLKVKGFMLDTCRNA